MALMDKISKPKRKVPIRDAAGDIIEVREVDDDPVMAGNAPLPAAVGPMPGVSGAMGGVNG